MLPAILRNSGSLRRPLGDNFIERFFCEGPSYVKETDFNWSPRVDVNETDKDILIDLELPGLDKKDIKVELKDNLLTISGERKEETKHEDAVSCRVERHYGKFERSFGLPDTVATEKLIAEYKNGVLNLTLPKNEKAIPKEIKVDVK